MSAPENLETVAPTDAHLQPEVKGLSQAAIVRKRFRGHTGAMVSIAVLAVVVVLALTSVGVGPWHGWWKYTHTDIPALQNGGRPTLSLWPFSLGEHPFGQDTVGRDYFAMTMRGTQISLFITVLVGVISAAVGVVIGASSGFFRGPVETVLMRFTDVMIIIPALVAAAVVGQNAKDGGVIMLGAFLGLISWTGMARLVRGDFLTLREREFVDAARLAGASNPRIIFKHILPNAVGVITVNTTLLMSAAILTETSLSYLGFGVQSPDTSLGKLISENQAAFSTRPWLFWFPGLFIITVCLCINFIGDGLRDAFDPRQKKLQLRRVRETGEAARRREANDRLVRASHAPAPLAHGEQDPVDPNPDGTGTDRG